MALHRRFLSSILAGRLLEGEGGRKEKGTTDIDKLALLKAVWPESKLEVAVSAALPSMYRTDIGVLTAEP